MDLTAISPGGGGGGGGGEAEAAWYGNIQYLLNISAVGALCCLFIFLFVKLRSDHRRMPGPTALATKLLAVWHATGREIARHCGADAAQFLLIEGGSCAVLVSIAVFAVFAVLPLNLYGGTAAIDDQFSKTTINHIEKGDSKTLANNTAPLEEYFQHRYPGKVYKVLVPMDLCALDDLVSDLVKVRNDISWLVARIDSKMLFDESESSGYLEGVELEGFGAWFRCRWRRLKSFWSRIMAALGFTDEDRLRRLQELRADLEYEVGAYKEGRARGAGIAFVIFKDVYTANKAVQDLRMERKRPIGQFFSVGDLQLGRNKWRVERAPLATDIYWNNLGSTKLSLKLRRVFVNTCLLLMLLFCSSPLAVISALKSAGRIINAEAMDHAQSWLAWLQSSSWAATVFFQFLPNVLIFVSMYIVIPSVLSYLSKFERHLTVSGEQRAALLKMVCFFLVNLILLRALVESSLEGAILRMGRCYLDGEDCKRIEQYMKEAADVSKNDMLQLVPEQNEERPLENHDIDNLRTPLVSGRGFGVGISINGASHENENELHGQDLLEYPINRSSPVPKQTFDFAQYYAFNLTIFALTMIYSSFAPLVVPVGTAYFGYRYVVDKYNFLFVYRVRGFPAGNDGKLMDTVLCIMRFCVDLFLLSMLLFFSVQGDSTKLQAIFTLGLFFLYKFLPSKSDRFQPSLLEGMQTVDNFMDGPTDYEILSEPKFDWDTYHI
ncbi:hypothetical protein Sjap_017388 [Stephania japonica]|uniref:CSC1-like protein n=1 Tax=Stephania japonica TaxID=461633 RepID=A0AAP0NJD5_9MAGN